VPALTFSEARATVLRQVQAALQPPLMETVPLGASQGRILAEDALADRDYPPFNRSVRDGFAMRAADLPGTCRVIGEVRAGETFSGKVSPGEAVEIMTGAPVPQGADAVVMVEHCSRNVDGTVSAENRLTPGTNIAARGCEATSQTAILARGSRIDYTGVSWLATTGHPLVKVFARPRVAIIATGDEIVEVGDEPAPHQIRNSNAWSLAAQVERAGAIPHVLPIARDCQTETRRLIERGLEADLLVLSGGVSAGKYDVVELALADLGAEFFFDRVLIQPGQPLVFGRARSKFFFGLPGNPASTMVTFELFARAAIELIGGAREAPLPLALARLTRAFKHKTGLTRFLPAHMNSTEVTPVAWQGSGDVPALCRANAFLVADANQPEYKEGDLIPVLFK
jgi:molybdopterin molybdotransferase